MMVAAYASSRSMRRGSARGACVAALLAPHSCRGSQLATTSGWSNQRVRLATQNSVAAAVESVERAV
jgi:hypothetical protein